MVVMLVDFLYQITFFPAVVLYLSARKKHKPVTAHQIVAKGPSKPKSRFIRDLYLPTILSPTGKVCDDSK
jgi:hypothetical protein